METMLLIVKELLPMGLAAALAYFIGFAEGFKRSAEKCKEILDKQLEYYLEQSKRILKK